MRTGAAGGFGFGFAACHAVCQTLITAFALFGVALLGTPIAFIQQYSASLLIVSAALTVWSVMACRKHGMPLKALMKQMGYGLVAAMLVLFVLLVALPPATTTEPPSSRCAPQEGYTPEEWREHVSHHPSLYRECLEEGGVERRGG